MPGPMLSIAYCTQCNWLLRSAWMAQEVLSTLREINRAYGTAILFVSHDLLALRSLCSRIAILADGSIVETRATEELFHNPQDPYTRRLLAALPQFEPA